MRDDLNTPNSFDIKISYRLVDNSGLDDKAFAAAFHQIATTAQAAIHGENPYAYQTFDGDAYISGTEPSGETEVEEVEEREMSKTMTISLGNRTEAEAQEFAASCVGHFEQADPTGNMHATVLSITEEVMTYKGRCGQPIVDTDGRFVPGDPVTCDMSDGTQANGTWLEPDEDGIPNACLVRMDDDRMLTFPVGHVRPRA